MVCRKNKNKFKRYNMTTLSFIKKYWKQISLFLAILSVVGLIWGLSITLHKLNEQKANYERMEDNLYHSNYAITSYKDKLNKTVYQNQALLLSKDELEHYNSSLIKEVDNLKIKLKNVQSVSNIQIEYQVIKDSIPVLYEKPFYRINYVDSGIIFKADLNTLTNALSNTKISLSDSLSIVWTYQTKGWWIFKRKTGLKLVFKSTNPYMNLKGMQNYYIIDFKNKFNKD